MSGVVRGRKVLARSAGGGIDDVREDGIYE
jgi:hypothetical protein